MRASQWLDNNIGPAMAIVSGFGRELKNLNDAGVITTAQAVQAIQGASQWAHSTIGMLSGPLDTDAVDAARAEYTLSDPGPEEFQSLCVEQLATLLGVPVENLVGTGTQTEPDQGDETSGQTSGPQPQAKPQEEQPSGQGSA